MHFISVWNLFRLDFSSGPLALQYSWSICKLGYQNFFCTIFGLTEQDVLCIFLTKCWLHIFFPVVNVFYRILCDITLFCIKFRDFCGRHVCNVFAYIHTYNSEKNSTIFCTTIYYAFSNVWPIKATFSVTTSKMFMQFTVGC